jgi:hypothetical protein
MRGNGSPDLWWFVVWIAIVLSVIMPRLLRSGGDDKAQSSRVGAEAHVPAISR